MFDTTLTVVGNVVDDPTQRTANGAQVASFRLASTSRRFDKESEDYVDGHKLFLTVNCWDDMAANVVQSLRKGQPIVVYGRLSSREYVKDEQRRVSYELVADAIGHNLARGRSEFVRSGGRLGVSSVATDGDGMPPDVTEDILSTGVPAGVPSGAGSPPF